MEYINHILFDYWFYPFQFVGYLLTTTGLFSIYIIIFSFIAIIFAIESYKHFREYLNEHRYPDLFHAIGTNIWHNLASSPSIVSQIILAKKLVPPNSQTQYRRSTKYSLSNESKIFIVPIGQQLTEVEKDKIKESYAEIITEILQEREQKYGLSKKYTSDEVESFLEGHVTILELTTLFSNNRYLLNQLIKNSPINILTHMDFSSGEYKSTPYSGAKPNVDEALPQSWSPLSDDLAKELIKTLQEHHPDFNLESYKDLQDKG